MLDGVGQRLLHQPVHGRRQVGRDIAVARRRPSVPRPPRPTGSAPSAPAGRPATAVGAGPRRRPATPPAPGRAGPRASRPVAEMVSKAASALSRLPASTAPDSACTTMRLTECATMSWISRAMRSRSRTAAASRSSASRAARSSSIAIRSRRARTPVPIAYATTNGSSAVARTDGPCPSRPVTASTTPAPVAPSIDEPPQRRGKRGDGVGRDQLPVRHRDEGLDAGGGQTERARAHDAPPRRPGTGVATPAAVTPPQPGRTATTRPTPPP